MVQSTLKPRQTSAKYLKLVGDHFPSSRKSNKIFNLNAIKTSCISIPNVNNLTEQHNLKILSKEQDKIRKP